MARSEGMNPLFSAENTPVIDSLRQSLRGDVLNDTLSRGIYATDASMYQMMPMAVVLPRDREDLIAAVRICAEHQISILMRAGGTSLTGQTVIQNGIVLDVSKYMNRLLEVNPEERWVRVEPGLVRDELNAQLKPHRLHFAPDPATSNRANVGGMIACNAAGMRSLQYGMTIDHVLELDVVLTTGEVLTLKACSPAEWAEKCAQSDHEGKIYRDFHQVIETHRERILETYPKVSRRSGGYALDAFTNEKPWNLAKLMVSSEGTLACILEARLNLEPVPLCSGLCLVHFGSMGECLRAVAPIVSHGPASVELLDGVVLRQAKGSRLSRETCRMIEGEPEGLLMVEVRDDDPTVVSRTLHAVVHDLQDQKLGYAFPLILDPEDIQAVWLMRSSALGLVTTVPGLRKPTPYIEDAAVPLESLPDYIEEVLAICRKYSQPVALFAHAGAGLLHIRPLHDLHDPADREQMKSIQREVFDTVRRYKGSWSGEHGDGIVRGGFNREFFGDELYEAFRTVKRLFDPKGLLNPGKVLDSPPMDSHLRFGSEYRPIVRDTLYHYRDFPGMLGAVEICTGVGACRKTNSGTMCPSYMATRDEAHSTRGRANALRLALSGQLGEQGLIDDGVYELLDLCLSCKGCKGECPNNVDLARLKAETLQARHDERGAPFRDRLIGRMPEIASSCSGALAPLLNAANASTPVRHLLEKVLGFDRRRPLPRFARQSLQTWFSARSPRNSEGPEVLLYGDAYISYYLPEVGRAAIRVLEAAGFRVRLERPADSQRSRISRGLLRDAKRDGQKLFEGLQPYTDRGVPVLCCEPSCWSALTDDLPDLLDDEELARSVGGQVFMIDRFLEDQLTAGNIELSLRSAPGLSILVHGHCHQKALEGPSASLNLLRRIPGASVRDSGAGCCGMAGAFGYEKNHYALSSKIAGQRLLPAIEQAGPETRLVTNGFSCRHQVHDLAGREAQHIVELLAEFLSSDAVSPA